MSQTNQEICAKWMVPSMWSHVQYEGTGEYMQVQYISFWNLKVWWGGSRGNVYGIDQKSNSFSFLLPGEGELCEVIEPSTVSKYSM